MRRGFLIFFLAIISVFFIFKSSSQVFAAPPVLPTPVHPSPPYTPPLNPNNFPCLRSNDPSFHPLRPYPASPCDPLIPKKIPEAPDVNPEKLYLTFMCSPSTEPQGVYNVKDVVDISGMGTFPGFQNAVLDQKYICPNTVDKICFTHLVHFNVSLNYSESQLPVMGNTQDNLSDAQKVNNYLSYYLNGTVLQAQKPGEPANPLNSTNNIYRLENFSGPVKKMLSYESQRTLRATLAGSPELATQYHNYIIDAGRIKVVNPINPNLPLSSLEDVTSEVVPALPLSQPGSPDGYPVPGTITLTIGSPSDSRLYFPHMKNTNALSDILSSFSMPSEIIKPVDTGDSDFVSQKITEHQGINDATRVQPGLIDYRTQWMLSALRKPNTTRNTEVIEGQLAPQRLYDSSDSCNLTVKNNPGDDFVGSTINTTLSFVMYFQYQPQMVIGNPCPSGGSSTCVSKPCATEGNACNPNQASSCCYNDCPQAPPGSCESTGAGDPYTCSNYVDCSSYSDSVSCVSGLAGMCCGWHQDSPVCPAWPTKDLKAMGRIAIYTKTPLIERIYNNLVGGATSVLRRFLPQEIATSSGIKTGRNTMPGGTIANYSASSPDLSGVSTSGGNALYFAHLGSLFNHFLGSGGYATNLNFQCLFRPAGSCAKPPDGGSFCHGSAFAKIMGSPDSPSSRAITYFDSYISANLTPDVVSAYEEGEKQTGVPCEVLAGIHFTEGNNDPNRDLLSGAPLSGSLIDAVIKAANHLKDHACTPYVIGGNCDIPDMTTLIKAMSTYNGGGNSNCQSFDSVACATGRVCGEQTSCDPNNPTSATCRCNNPATFYQPGSCRATCASTYGDVFPYKFTYGGSCPPPMQGWDDPYVTNWWKSPDHDAMSLLYLYDCTALNPQPYQRPGGLTVGIIMFLKTQGVLP